jgi:hypothetical protein
MVSPDLDKPAAFIGVLIAGAAIAILFLACPVAIQRLFVRLSSARPTLDHVFGGFFRYERLPSLMRTAGVCVVAGLVAVVLRLLAG